MQLKATDGLTGKAELFGVTREVSLMLCPDVQPGEHVLVHVGFVLSRVDEAEATKTLAMIKEVMAEELES
jgi:hydrogenase expression/formation protein HypC